MLVKKSILLLFLLTTNTLFAENKEVSTLLEKVNQAHNKEKKKELIEELKIKLANENKKVRQEADAIIKAKKKLPLKIYEPKP